MAHYDVKTLPELHKAIKQAAEVLVQPRFGSSERWIKLPKYEAWNLYHDLVNGRLETPEEAEMYTSTFGTFDGHTLHLG